MKSPYSLVIGLGATGVAAARYLASQGRRVLVMDSRSDPPGLPALVASHPQIETILGAFDNARLAGAELVVVSPGLPIDLPLLAAARARGLAVVSEIELFARAASVPVLAVTGSNGKSTVASLLAHLLSSQDLLAPAGGNLDPPALTLLEHRDADCFVLEISSFQLESTTSLRPRAAAVLNISPDHMDRHGTLAHYAELKEHLLPGADTAVVNHDDAVVRAMGERAASRGQHIVEFSTTSALTEGWSIVQSGGTRWLARNGVPQAEAHAVGLTGTVHEANALAALALAESMIVDWPAAFKALALFEGLPHRLQRVAEVGEVTYIDDSKGTNVGATVAAIAAMDRPLVLIAGGLGKGADFAPLAAAGRGRLRAAILIGEAASALAQVLDPVCVTSRARDMPEAVAMAAAAARKGDVVLLSPACASQDMFSDYSDRGRVFAGSVEALRP